MDAAKYPPMFKINKNKIRSIIKINDIYNKLLYRGDLLIPFNRYFKTLFYYRNTIHIIKLKVIFINFLTEMKHPAENSKF